MVECNRRHLLCGLGGLAVGGLAAGMAAPGLAAEAQAPAGKRFAQVNGEFGWKPHKLDPAECEIAAYEGYWYKGYACGARLRALLGPQGAHAHGQRAFPLV